MIAEEIIDNDLNSLAGILAYFLGCEVRPDGTLVEIRQEVARVGGVKISVYPNEHPPPHFHVHTAERSAAFAIADCALLNGNLGRKDQVRVRHWFHEVGKDRVKAAWDRTRPGGCSVGYVR